MTNIAVDLAETSGKTDFADTKATDWVFRMSAAWLVIVVVFVVLGELNPLVGDPDVRDASMVNAPPGWPNIFGNDSFGQSIFDQVVIGGRISIFVATTVTFIGIFVGGAMGLVGGYFKGWFDSAMRLIINTTLSIPALLLVIFIVTVRGRSLANVIFAVSLLAIPALARIVRGSTLQVADRDFVKAAEVLGVKRTKILFQEVLPNVMPTMISFAFLTTGIVLVAESSLSFLGLSVESPSITWGSIIAGGRPKFNDAPHVVFAPAIVLFLTVLSLNFVGDRLLKRYDIKEASL
ncbi:ABC transporter permease [Ilumatobacter nonamiensis]|uniref:ABC transporter permease n=1 Tax=Ilumatobacter nonamiensis TaxID=467093 RepID=UPI0003481B24|nr:ABC transporter permease [Ilumatobacter nonamiensis]